MFETDCADEAELASMLEKDIIKKGVVTVKIADIAGTLLSRALYPPFGDFGRFFAPKQGGG